MAEWCSVVDAKKLTGVTVTQDDRDRAAAILAMLTGLIEEVVRTDVTDRDAYFLKLACGYQAAWVHDNPDLFQRADVTSASQDGDSTSFRNVDAHLLAPLARKAIRRLSWRGLRAVLPGGGTPPRTSLVDINSEAYDDALPWAPVE